MTFPTRPLALALLMVPFAIACNGETPTDTDTDPDPGTEGTDAPDYFEPTGFFVDGQFGWDADAQQVRPALDPAGDEIPTFLEFTLQDESGNVCSIQFVTSSVLNEPAWIATNNADTTALATVYAGFTVDAAAQNGTDCTDFEFDPDVFGETDAFIERILGFDLGLGVNSLVNTTDVPIGTRLEETVVQQADQATYDEDFAPFVIGGGFFVSQSEANPGQFIPFNWALGFAVDENFQLTYNDLDNNGEFNEGDTQNRILASEFDDDVAPSGVYSVNGFFGPSTDPFLTLDAE